MDSRITKKFEKIRNKGQKALITYITAGDPNLDTTYRLVLHMEKAGVDIIELGIPYSDPLADGPVIQRAAQRALKSGANMDNIFKLVEKIRLKTELPIVFLVYFNCVFNYGFKRFLDECKEKGIDGLIIPDLPLEERKGLHHMMGKYPIDLIPMVAPTSEDRIRDIVNGGKGFVYCISSRGVTGKRNTFETNLNEFLQQVRKNTDLPLALGFGISNAETVERLKKICDGLIVGSAIIEQIELGIKSGKMEERVFKFVQELAYSKSI